VKVPVVDNGGQWTHREWRVLRDLGAESTIVPNDAPPETFADADGVVLSGGALSVPEFAEMGRLGEWIDRFDRPVLGICVGHHYLARHFGGEVSHSGSPEYGRVRIELDRADSPLFLGLGASLEVWESHNDIVSKLPPGWVRLATSESCPIQAMADPARPRFGVQYHPEVAHTEGGERLFENFLALCRR
jgi:GMP synthase (glutamine-hydrolysing)